MYVLFLVNMVLYIYIYAIFAVLLTLKIYYEKISISNFDRFCSISENH